MHIEIKHTNTDDYKLFINGVADNKTSIGIDVLTYQIYSSNTFLIEELKTWSINKLRDFQVSMLRFELSNDSYYERIFYLFIDKGENAKFAVDWFPKSENWNKIYSISDFANEIKLLCDNEIEFNRGDELDEGFGIQIKNYDDKKPIKQCFEDIISYSQKIEEQIEKKLVKNLNKSSIIEYFDFPLEYETACRQYLSYFIDFLRDIGINATSDILTDNNKTIFIIKPTDKNQALGLIKDALTIYLNLPTVPQLQTLNIINQDIAVQQLISNIQFLQSQIALGNAILQSKEATIKSLELTNYQLSYFLGHKDIDKSQRHGEDIIKGILSVDKFEKNGFTINLAELLRRLKRKLK